MALGLRQLEVLNAVLRAGTMSAAARALRISQPAVSRMVAATEQQVGVKLFTRDGVRLVPTPELLELGPSLGLIFDHVDAVQGLAALLKHGSGRTLRLAASPALAFGILPEAAARLHKRFPKAQVITRVRDGEAIKRGLVRRDFDFGLIYNETWMAPFEAHPICETLMVCLLPEHHPLAARDRITPADLRGVPLVSFGSTSRIGADLDRIFEDAGEWRELAVAAGNSFMAAAFVQAGGGIGLTDPFVLGTPAAAGVVGRPFSPTRRLVPQAVHALGRELAAPEHAVIESLLEAGAAWTRSATRRHGLGTVAEGEGGTDPT